MNTNDANLSYRQRYTKIFEPDETQLLDVAPQWTAEMLLEQKAVFWMHDVVDLLGLDPDDIRRRARMFRRKGNAWNEMGVGKVWNRWLVRMSVFSEFYQQNPVMRVSSIRPEWGLKTLLAQPGVFRLNEVCARLCFSLKAIRQKAMETGEDSGVWKSENGVYLVDMSKFGPWVRYGWFYE